MGCNSGPYSFSRTCRLLIFCSGGEKLVWSDMSEGMQTKVRAVMPTINARIAALEQWLKKYEDSRRNPLVIPQAQLPQVGCGRGAIVITAMPFSSPHYAQSGAFCYYAGRCRLTDQAEAQAQAKNPPAEDSSSESIPGDDAVLG